MRVFKLDFFLKLFLIYIYINACRDTANINKNRLEKIIDKNNKSNLETESSINKTKPSINEVDNQKNLNANENKLLNNVIKETDSSGDNLYSIKLDPETIKTKQNIRIEASEEYGKVLVVLIHGLTMIKAMSETLMGFDKLKKKIKEAFPNKRVEILTVQLGNSLDAGINEQAVKAYKKLKKELYKKQIRSNTKIVLVGHSAGGLVSYSLYSAHKDEFDIAGIVTISCPWKGSKMVECKDKAKFVLKFALNKINKHYCDNKLGIKDTKSGSKYLEWVEESLKKCTIPIYAIGGETKYYSGVFTIKSLYSFCIKENVSEQAFFGADGHDGVVATNSQLGIDLDNITPIKIKEPVNHSLSMKNSLEKFAENFTNFFKCMISEETREKLLKIKFENAITEADQTIETIINFIKKYALKPVLEEEEKFRKAVEVL